MFGLSPAEEVRKGVMNMAINWACYIALVLSENEEYKKAEENKQLEGVALAKFLDEINEVSTTARK